jgi:3-isopropylmalate/(R)-2-methylmalate dehydratase small subunit
MQPFTTHTGLVAPLDRVNVDTDQLLPKQYLKRIERTGFGAYLFWNWRFHDDGTPIATFVLNQPRYVGATVLVSGHNFGSGSSREHAVWALTDFGFRAVIAPSFADIFYNNCFKNGLLPITLPEGAVDTLMKRASSTEGYQVTVDLEQNLVWDNEGLRESFAIEPFRRHCMLNGLDDIGLTLQLSDRIAVYEQRRGIISVS